MQIKFHNKIYLISFLLLLVFVISSILHQINTEEISDNIKKLNQKNESLQKILLLVLDIEKLNKNTNEFIVSGDKELLKNINNSLNKFGNIDSKENIINDENLKKPFEKIIENIEHFKDDFTVAQKHIPMNLNFRKDVRIKSQNLENIIDNLILGADSQNEFFDLVLSRKSILELEKNLFRYFETDDSNFLSKLKNEQVKFKSLLEKILSNNRLNEETNNLISKKSIELLHLINKIISHYRTYSMITKVILPGNIYEINFYSQEIEKISLNEINLINKEIEILLDKNKKFNFYTSIFYIVLVLFIIYFFSKVLFKPIERLTLMFENIINGKKNVEIPKYNQDDMIGKLINAAIAFNKLNKKTNSLLKETEDYKNNLELKVKEEIELRREKEKALIQSSKLASMGEMIGAIAHQWRQPLNELSIRIQKLKYNYAKEQINEEFIYDFIEKNKKTIDFMSKTIDDFRNFFRIDKEKTNFSIDNSIKEVISIVSAQLKSHNILLTTDVDDFIYNGFKTELQQVLINIISNSKDAFIEKGIKNPKITIIGKDNKIMIRDNAGGIPNNILDRVFEPYFTTKDQGEGTGMGLYMSKMIIEDNMKGKLIIKNEAEGVSVLIQLKSK